MNKNLKKSLLLAILISSVACSNVKNKTSEVKVEAKETSVHAKVNDESKLALLWQQDAGEYNALVYQAFNIAKDSITDNGITKLYVDIDEVVLDNTPYLAWLVINDKTNNIEDYTRWVNSQDAPAVVGSVEFLNSVSDKVEVIYVSDRGEKFTNATVSNIKKIGVKGDVKLVSSEVSARNLENETAMFISTSLNSFNPALSENLKSRNSEAFAMSEDMGAKKILVPNLMYGEYQDALAENFENLNAEERTQAKLNTLNYWKGSKETEIKEF